MNHLLATNWNNHLSFVFFLFQMHWYARNVCCSWFVVIVRFILNWNKAHNVYQQQWIGKQQASKQTNYPLSNGITFPVWAGYAVNWNEESGNNKNSDDWFSQSTLLHICFEDGEIEREGERVNAECRMQKLTSKIHGKISNKLTCL